MTSSASAHVLPVFVRDFFNKYLIDAFTGMALGLFVTLIAGLIFSQVGQALEMPLLMDLGKLASILMGAGIGVGIAYYLKAPTLVVFACLVAGMMGAHSEALMAGQLFTPQAGAPATFWPYQAIRSALIWPLSLPTVPAAGFRVRPSLILS
nr:PTS sugar transporter subunit IIC [Psychrobacter sp. PraFG1]UNK05361.1 PTS sugar transporter subunit IIC [Psychrobacter sp. PraFG1]